MKKITPEIIKNAKEAKTCDELREMLNANGVEVSDEEVKKYFAQLKDGEISDEDLSTVAGGGICEDRLVSYESGYANRFVKVVNGKKCPVCGGDEGKTRISPRVAPMQTSGNLLEVRCRKCDVKILEAFRMGDVEFL